MKIIIGVIGLIACIFMYATNARLNALDERIKFVCSIPIVTDKTVLLARERDGKWVFDADLAKTFYYVPGGCN